jgi:PAS domain S-box-containing protein
VSFNLVKLIPDSSLFLEVEELIRQVRLSGERARLDRPALIELDGAGAGDLSLEAVPLDGGRKRSILVIFEPVRGPQPAEPVAEDSRPEMDPRDRQILKLERQLDLAKQRFLTAIEEHQSSREESQNTTEEALSANEELQSLNEELETAKEELQSSNEELVTVNSELQTTNAALSQARDFAMSIVETVRQPLLVLDSQLRIRMANRAFIRAFGTSPGKAEGQSIYLLSRGLWDSAGLREALETLLQGANSFPEFEVEQEFPRGRRTLVLGGCRINHLKMFLLAVDDVTEHKQAIQAQRRSEEHLRQAQKMEAVGRLAGGIAHDFNNLLTGILGYSSLLCDRLAGDQAAIDHVLQIQGAGERAAALTQQLLAFSRRQVLQPKVFDLNVIVADFDRMLRRLVGERIQVVLECAPDLWRVRADPGEIGRALMNLSLNARDAMPSGGTLAIETANLSVTGDGSTHDLNAGRYVSLAVRDTGVGIDAAAREHIFEPFFTTKDLGKGTGLGLATVLGIVEQSGGTIRCDSEPGTGTTFTILMPAVDERIGDGTPPATRLATAPRGTEVILLVEDEDMVRVLARRILVASGYVVHEARNGREGLSFCKAHPGPIDLLLSDVVMPEVGGRELADVVLGLRPGVKVLFMSGHTEDVILKEGVQQGAPFLQKPFTPAALAQKVRETLDASVGGASALA